MKSISKDKSKFYLDLSFYSLACIAFYKNYLLSIFSIIILFVVYRYTEYYFEDEYEKRLDLFIDFLNQINASFYMGLSLESAINQIDLKNFGKDDDFRQSMDYLKQAISLGLNGRLLLDEIDKIFHIEECRLYIEMLKLGEKTGASASKITEITLNNLYTKFRTVSEARLIIYQKKIEQRILSIAPILIIIFIGISGGAFLEILYASTIGRFIMTISFFMLITMKIVGVKIVESIK